MDYTVLIAPLAFLAAVQLNTKLSLGTFSSASLAVGLPFVIDRVLAWVTIIGRDVPFFSNVFPIDSLLTAATQLALAWYAFKTLQLSDDYSTWLTWVIGGGLAVVYGVPMAINLIVNTL